MVSWVRLRRRLGRNRGKLGVLIVGSGLLAGALFGLAKTGTAPFDQIPHLIPKDKEVVQEEAKEIKSLSDQEGIFSGAEEILKANGFLRQANEDLANNNFMGVEEKLEEAYKHFLKAEELGIEVSHYLKEVEDLYKKLVQDDYDLLKIDVQRLLASHNYEDAFGKIDQFKERVKRTAKFIDKGFYDAEAKLLLGQAHTAFVEHKFDMARGLVQSVRSPEGVQLVEGHVKEALDFMGKNKSKALRIDVDKLRLEGNLIKGEAYSKLAEIYFLAFQDNKNKNPEFAIQQLRLAKNEAINAKNLGFDVRSILRQINSALSQIVSGR